MANPKHLAILEQGVATWNKWRQENLRRVPKLSGADLFRRNLAGADLSGADLSSAHAFDVNLSSADLSHANLREADFAGTNLSRADLNNANLYVARVVGADLSDADLREVNLSWAVLYDVNLRGANLFRADLRVTSLMGADLTGANVDEAYMGHTLLSDDDLSTVEGLEFVHHEGPSTIGLDTIYRSRGNIPEVFLRGVGAPDDLIVYMRSLVAKPINFYSCFISYSSKDQEFAERLHTDLRSKGVRCWFAPEDLKIGDRFQERIEESIRVYDKLMVVLSTNSVNSVWVEREVNAGFEKEQRHPERPALFPIRLDDAVMETPKAWAADIRRTRHIGDFRNWKDHDAFKEGFDRLLRDLQADTTPPEAERSQPGP